MSRQHRWQESELWRTTSRKHHMRRMLRWKELKRDQLGRGRDCLPVAPKTLPRGNSHIPARSWTRPPAKMAIPTTTLGVVTPRACTLIRERMKVVDAKEKRPLHFVKSVDNVCGSGKKGIHTEHLDFQFESVWRQQCSSGSIGWV